MLFTSGSSGAPKGVLHTQATLAYKATLMQHVHDLAPDDCVLMPAPARAHLRAPQRRHAARRRAVPDGVHGALGSGARARPHRARARHVHGRPADVLRLDDAGRRVRARSGCELAPDLERRRGSERRVRRRRERGVRRAREAHVRLDRSADGHHRRARDRAGRAPRRRQRASCSSAAPRCAWATSTPRRRARGVHRRRLVPHRRPRDDRRATESSTSSGA